METTLFYTLSTIAQTLAGAIGLLGAFVLYRLQLVSGELDACSEHVIAAYPGEEGEALRALHVQGRYRDLLDYTGQHPLASGPNTPTPWSARCARLGHLLAYRNRVITRPRWSLIMAASGEIFPVNKSLLLSPN